MTCSIPFSGNGPCTNRLANHFSEVVNRYPDLPAIAFSEEDVLSYRALDELSNQVAWYLLELGLKKGDCIGLCLDKSTTFYITVLAAIKLGTPYFALDPQNPLSRIGSIVQRCQPKVIFSHQPLDIIDYFSEAKQVLCPTGFQTPDIIQGHPNHFPDREIEVISSDPAYIMFTSGSTGVPKGAVISHGNLEHFISWATTEYQFTPEDVHTHLNPVYFDNSVFDIYTTLFSGGKLVPFTQDVLANPVALAQRLQSGKCTVWFSVPSLLIFLQVMKVMTPEFFGSLQKIIFGGEGYPKVKLKALMDTLGNGIKFYNVSGPTECTCICSSYQVTEADFQDLAGFPPLGALTQNFCGYILDEDIAASPGSIGELCLSGPCVGLGYYNQSDLTDRAFVQNPLNSAYREIVYRTGDLVRLNPDDQKLYFIGRKDFQIKHMGYRIELEEIQHAVNLHPAVHESAVLYDANKKEIFAVVAIQQEPDLSTFRETLSQLVPRYMMPGKFYFLERLPKNANGKTDRQFLLKQYGSEGNSP